MHHPGSWKKEKEDLNAVVSIIAFLVLTKARGQASGS
jgi:hypothetical protein